MSKRTEICSLEAYSKILNEKLIYAYQLSEVVNSYFNGHIDESDLTIRAQDYTKTFATLLILFDTIDNNQSQISQLCAIIRSKKEGAVVLNLGDYADQYFLMKKAD